MTDEIIAELRAKNEKLEKLVQQLHAKLEYYTTLAEAKAGTKTEVNTAVATTLNLTDDEKREFMQERIRTLSLEECIRAEYGAIADDPVAWSHFVNRRLPLRI